MTKYFGFQYSVAYCSHLSLVKQFTSDKWRNTMPSGPRTAHTIACSFSRWIFWAAAARSSAVTTRAASLMRSNSPQSTIVLAPDGSSRRILITRTRHRNENASRHLVRLFLLKIKVHGYHAIFERSVNTAVPILRPSPGAPFLWFGSVVDLLQTFPGHRTKIGGSASKGKNAY